MATPQQSTGFRLEIRRTFAAPRERVFAAWTEQTQLEKWMCKDVASQVVTYHEHDPRTGGSYRMEVRDQKTGEVYWGRGVYREVRPPERLVFTWAWTKESAGGRQAPLLHPETQVTVEFFARGASTEILLTHEVFRSAKDRDEHDQGWKGCFDMLEKVLRVSGSN